MIPVTFLNIKKVKITAKIFEKFIHSVQDCKSHFTKNNDFSK